MKVRYYEGKRIYFRPIELEDEARFRAWLNDSGNWAPLGRARPINALREREFIEKLYKEGSREVALAICLKEGDRLIGVCGLHQLHPVNRCALFGIVIGDREYQNQGYGTEATRLMVRYGFEELNLNRIGLSVFADNRRAMRAYEKVGFIQEGCRRQAFYRGGRYQDELVFGLLRKVWRPSRGLEGNRMSDVSLRTG